MEESNQEAGWFKGAVRPLITLAIVAMFIAVMVHGTIYSGDRQAFEAVLTVTSLVVGYWFGGREATKRK